MTPMLNWTRNPPQNLLRQIIGVDTMYIQYCYKEYDKNHFFNVYVLAHGVTNDATHMQTSKFFRIPMRRWILQEPSINIEGETIKPYIIKDSTYHLLQQI